MDRLGYREVTLPRRDAQDARDAIIHFLWQVSKRLLLLKKLDGYPIIREEDDNEDEDAAAGDSDSDSSEDLNQ